MEGSRKYYEAYDDRYRQVHREDLRWFSDMPSAIVSQVVGEFSVGRQMKILELGCGEGRDAAYLLERGYSVLATDISPEAIGFCRKENPRYAERFRVLDCVNGSLEGSFDLIYAVAVVHMLVPDEDRNRFYGFIRDHLTADGIALICTMGDGETEVRSDIRRAFELQERNHQYTGQTLMLAGTSCRMVSTETFVEELEKNGLGIIKQGMTSVEPDFPQMMYAVVKRMYDRIEYPLS